MDKNLTWEPSFQKFEVIRVQNWIRLIDFYTIEMNFFSKKKLSPKNPFFVFIKPPKIPFWSWLKFFLKNSAKSGSGPTLRRVKVGGQPELVRATRTRALHRIGVSVGVGVGVSAVVGVSLQGPGKISGTFKFFHLSLKHCSYNCVLSPQITLLWFFYLIFPPPYDAARIRSHWRVAPLHLGTTRDALWT